MSNKTKIFSAVIECPNSKQVAVGDICYALDDEIYSKVWGKKLNYKDGVVQDKENVYALTVGTYIGDGCYTSALNKMYPVDSGTLGVTNLDFVDKNNSLRLCHIVNVPNGKCRVFLHYRSGLIRITIFDDRQILLFDDEIDTYVD